MALGLVRFVIIVKTDIARWQMIILGVGIAAYVFTTANVLP